MEKMRFLEIGEHKRREHGEVLQAIQESTSEQVPGFLKVIVPSFIGLFIAFFLLLYIGLESGAWSPRLPLLVLVNGVLVTLIAGYVVLRRQMTHANPVLESVEVRCWICDQRMPRGQARTHIETLHPREARYVRLSAKVVIGFVLGLSASVWLSLNLFLLRLLPNEVFEGLTRGFVLLFAGFMVGVLLWGLVVHPWHERRSRERVLGPGIR